MPNLENPIAIFLTIMTIILVTPLLSERIRLPGIVGIILGGMVVGPHGLNLLSAEGSIDLLATIGLIYLMFTAGLEVDLHQFLRVRQKAIGFGLLTFLFPQVLGMALGRWLGMSWLGALLLGSAFASHTLIALPILTRFGVIKNDAISITTGATVFTDIAAFIVLSVVLSLDAGSLDLFYFIRLAVLFGLYAAFVLYGLPRLGKLFFQRFSGRVVEFQFVLVALFVSAVLAELVGVHAVVGAFLAGLAINATISHHSPATSHLLFLGESLFIPIFLLHSGMLTDPFVFLESPNTLWIGLGVTFVAYVSKLLAAVLAGRIFRYTRSETMAVWGLSQAQAAVTIPTLVIGLGLGLFSEDLFNAAILMILLTSITSPLIVQRFAPRLSVKAEQPASGRPFRRILVPIANPETQEPLLSLAALLAHAGDGTLLALHVARESPGGVGVIGGPRPVRGFATHMGAQLQQQKTMLERVSGILQDPELRVELVPRLDTSVARGVLRTMVERDVTLVLMGWTGDVPIRSNVFGSLLDEVVWRAPIPVAVARLTAPVNAIRRVVLALPHHPLGPALIRQTLALVVPLANALKAPLLVVSGAENLNTTDPDGLAARLDQGVTVERLHGELAGELAGRVDARDLVVMSTLGPQGRFRITLGSAGHSSAPEKLAAQSACSIIVVHYP